MDKLLNRCHSPRSIALRLSVAVPHLGASYEEWVHKPSARPQFRMFECGVAHSSLCFSILLLPNVTHAGLTLCGRDLAPLFTAHHPPQALVALSCITVSNRLAAAEPPHSCCVLASSLPLCTASSCALNSVPFVGLSRQVGLFRVVCHHVVVHGAGHLDPGKWQRTLYRLFCCVFTCMSSLQHSLLC